MSEKYAKLTADEKLELIESMLPIELALKEMAGLCKTKEEFSLSVMFTEMRKQLMIERHNLAQTAPTSLGRWLTAAARKIMQKLNGES